MAWRADSAPDLRTTGNARSSPSPDQLDSDRLIVYHGAVKLLPLAICRHGHCPRTCRRRQAYTVSQRQPKITPGTQQRAAKLSLPGPKSLLHFQLKFVKIGRASCRERV